MKYVAFYDVSEYKSENRYVNAAARTVVEYMIKVFSSFDKVEVISPARTVNKKGIYKGRDVQLSDNTFLKLPFTFGVKSKIGRAIAVIWTQLWLFFYLFFNTKRGEKVVFYHSISTMRTITLLTKLKGIKPILEFREIYSDINAIDVRSTKREHEYYKCAYGFIFPSEALKNCLDIGEKPYVLAPGSYETHDSAVDSFGDGKIHCVYAGNLRKDKGGAYLAIEVAPHLTENYVIHILSGSYSSNEFVEFQTAMEDIKTKAKAQIIFEGSKFGKEFFDFLNKCDIGLATQQNGEFSNTSFPSKILTYLGCGLKVVSPSIDAVTMSPVADFVFSYSEFSADSIAKVIFETQENSDICVKKSIQELDCTLKEKMKLLLEGVKYEKDS